MTSEGEARIAADALAAEHDLYIPGRLIDGDRDPLPERVWMYNAPTAFPAGLWVGLAIPVKPELLTSSTVIGVQKATGEAVNLGSAGDEG